jgi:hypothetical protein
MPWWKVVLALAVVTAIGIFVVGPQHDELQMAANAEVFRANLEHPGRQLAAAIIDLAFAASYGLLAFMGYRMAPFRPALRRAAIAIVAFAAACDEIENGFLIRNILARRSLTDAWVDAMQVPGTLKWIGSPAVAVVMVWAIARVIRRSPSVSPERKGIGNR